MIGTRCSRAAARALASSGRSERRPLSTSVYSPMMAVAGYLNGEERRSREVGTIAKIVAALKDTLQSGKRRAGPLHGGANLCGVEAGIW